MKNLVLFLHVLVMTAFLSVMGLVSASAESTVTVSKVTVSQGGTVSVPVELTDNSGICGATLKFTYDSDLILTDVSKGNALTSLTMSTSGSINNKPLVILWDGMDTDYTNGTILILTFLVPSLPKTYEISVFYEPGEIFDGSIEPIDLKLEQGHIKMGTEIMVSVGDKSVVLRSDKNASGEIIVGFFDDFSELIQVEMCKASDGDIALENKNSASSASVMWWENISSLKPLCNIQRIPLN